MRTPSGLLIVCCFPLLMGAACGSAGKSPQSPQSYRPGLTTATVAGSAGSAGGEVALAESTNSADATEATESESGSETDAPPPSTPVPEGRQQNHTPRGKKKAVKRRVIKTANLTIITSHPKDGFDKAVRMAKQMGGYTLDSRRTDKRLQITLRLPSARFEEALRRLSKLGKVDKRAIGGQDVTTEYVDLTMRLANAQRVRLRYIELLKRANNVEEALKVQKELERITGQIESLKARVSVIDSQVSLSTVQLTLETPTTPGPVGWVFYGLYKGITWLFIWN
jgi:Domain of unknown function (DUF4349)